MLKKISLAMVLASACSLPALAQGASCTAPAAPAAVDPAKATVDQIRGALTSAQGFIAASDTYQICLATGLQAQKDQAKKDNQPFDPAIEAGVAAKVDANQQLKVKVGTDANNAITGFKTVHACVGKTLAECK